MFRQDGWERKPDEVSTSIPTRSKFLKYLSFRRGTNCQGGICFPADSITEVINKQQIPPRRYAPCRNDKVSDVYLLISSFASSRFTKFCKNALLGSGAPASATRISLAAFA